MINFERDPWGRPTTVQTHKKKHTTDTNEH